MQNASEIVDSVLTAFVSSSEETSFGNCFFEPIAIAASGGNKALAEGIDIMIQNNETNTIFAIAVKSGPSVFNADSKKRQEQNFTAASKLAQQAKARYEAYIGYCYGKKKDSGRGKPKMYQELAGKRFWAELTGDEEFYKSMPHMAILPAMTLDDEERNDVVAKGAGVCALMFTIASSFSTQLVEIFGSYRNLMCFYAVFAIISFWGLYKTSEEKYVMPKQEGDGGLKQLIYVFRHKEIWPVMVVWCLAAVSYGFMFTSSVYYAQYILAGQRVDFATMDEAAIGATVGGTISPYMLFISMGALISMMILMPIFLKKFKTGY